MVSTTTGRFEVVVLARFGSTDGLYEFVQKELAEVEGLRDSEVFASF